MNERVIELSVDGATKQARLLLAGVWLLTLSANGDLTGIQNHRSGTTVSINLKASPLNSAIQSPSLQSGGIAAHIQTTDALADFLVRHSFVGSWNWSNGRRTGDIHLTFTRKTDGTLIGKRIDRENDREEVVTLAIENGRRTVRYHSNGSIYLELLDDGTLRGIQHHTAGAAVIMETKANAR